MKNFLKLLNFELNRFSKLYIVLLITIFAIQFIGIIVVANKYMMSMSRSGMSQQQFLDMFSAFSMLNFFHSMWFFAPVAIGAATLIIYIFFIWYRDWFAKNTFIYRLLMLPTSRMNIFWAKAITIMLTVLGLVAFQILLFIIESMIITWRTDVSLVDMVSAIYELSLILPSSMLDFFISYGLGFAFVLVCFTAILFERSFKIKGIVVGVLYILFAAGLFALPFIVQFFFLGDLYFYPDEILLIELFIWFLVVVSSVFISRYLLNNKVTV